MNNPATTDHSRLLIIDDNRAIHDDFRKILIPKNHSSEQFEESSAKVFGQEPTADSPSANRYQLDSAYQGKDGLALVQQAVGLDARYAMAFVDVRMPPGWDGIETTARMWEADPDLQVVI